MVVSKPFPLLIVLSFACTLTINQALLGNKVASSPKPAAYHTPLWLQQHITLGYSKTLAVLYWFDFISKFAGKSAEEVDYAQLADKLDTITMLNPHASYAYYTAATVLTWQIHSTRFSGPLLERGIEKMPEDWRWRYYRGFYSYFFDHDQDKAIKLLTIAAKNPDVPLILIRVIAKMRAQKTGLNTALTFLQQMLRRKQDPTLKTALKKQIQFIKTEKILRKLDQALKAIPNWNGDMQQLLHYNIHLPNKLPDGGKVMFDKQHHPFSSVQKRRYNLAKSPVYKRINQ